MRTPEEAAAFVDQVGFCTWTSLKRCDSPNLAAATKRIYEFLGENGPTPTRNLRSGTWLSGKKSKSAYEKAMVDLQRHFVICKVRLTGRTRGKHGYIWDLTDRWLPELVEEASHLERSEAIGVICQRCEE